MFSWVWRGSIDKHSECRCWCPNKKIGSPKQRREKPTERKTGFCVLSFLASTWHKKILIHNLIFQSTSRLGSSVLQRKRYYCLIFFYLKLAKLKSVVKHRKTERALQERAGPGYIYGPPGNCTEYMHVVHISYM